MRHESEHEEEDGEHQEEVKHVEKRTYMGSSLNEGPFLGSF